MIFFFGANLPGCELIRLSLYANLSTPPIKIWTKSRGNTLTTLARLFSLVTAVPHKGATQKSGVILRITSVWLLLIGPLFFLGF